MTNKLISRIYVDILNNGFVPHQYFYQRLKGRLTGRFEFMLRKPDGMNFFMIRGQDELLCMLDGAYIESNNEMTMEIRCVHSRRFLYKKTVKWCIRYMWESVKKYVKIGS